MKRCSLTALMRLLPLAAMDTSRLSSLPLGNQEPAELPAGAAPCRGVAPSLRAPTATPDDSGTPPLRPPTAPTAVVSGAWPCGVVGVNLPDCCACAFAKGAKGDAPLPSAFAPLREGSGVALAAVAPSAALARGCAQGSGRGQIQPDKGPG